MNAQARMTRGSRSWLGHSCFVIRHSFVIRHWAFVIRRERVMNLFDKFPQGLSYGDFLARYANDGQKLRWRQVYEQVVLTPAQSDLLGSFRREMNVLCLAGA